MRFLQQNFKMFLDKKKTCIKIEITMRKKFSDKLFYCHLSYGKLFDDEVSQDRLFFRTNFFFYRFFFWRTRKSLFSIRISWAEKDFGGFTLWSYTQVKPPTLNEQINLSTSKLFMHWFRIQHTKFSVLL